MCGGPQKRSREDLTLNTMENFSQKKKVDEIWIPSGKGERPRGRSGEKSFREGGAKKEEGTD